MDFNLLQINCSDDIIVLFGTYDFISGSLRIKIQKSDYLYLDILKKEKKGPNSLFIRSHDLKVSIEYTHTQKKRNFIRNDELHFHLNKTEILISLSGAKFGLMLSRISWICGALQQSQIATGPRTHKRLCHHHALLTVCDQIKHKSAFASNCLSSAQKLSSLVLIKNLVS